MPTLHGGHGTLTYARWKSMMQRCYNKKATNYRYYGALGIRVCEHWHDFAAFLTDMGACPDRSMTLDRLKNEIDYTPGNCRWATKADQNRNRPNHCVQLTHMGITRTITEWAVEIGMPANVLGMRIRDGWSVDRALSTPRKLRSPARRSPSQNKGRPRLNAPR